MNHDYAHCADYKPDCPKGCFRARLVRDLENIDRRIPMSWMHFRGTDECPRKDGEQNDGDILGTTEQTHEAVASTIRFEPMKLDPKDIDLIHYIDVFELIKDLVRRSNGRGDKR